MGCAAATGGAPLGSLDGAGIDGDAWVAATGDSREVSGSSSTCCDAATLALVAPSAPRSTKLISPSVALRTTFTGPLC